VTAIGGQQPHRVSFIPMLDRTETETAPETPDAPRAPDRPFLDDTSLCPYLRTTDGDWRASWALRDHRCGAVEPPAPLTGEKQRRLCLVPGHLECATFQAAEQAAAGSDRARDPESSAADHRPPATRWPVPRTAPVLLDRSGRALIGWHPDRSVAQVGLVVLMVLAFLMLAYARLSAPPDPTGSETPASPAASASAGPSPGGSAVAGTPVASSDASGDAASVSPGPSVGVDASSAPEGTYRVQSGDTLSGIAARFGTTVNDLRALNSIDDPSRLRVGQVLVIRAAATSPSP
jgi:LysM repeat protein